MEEPAFQRTGSLRGSMRKLLPRVPDEDQQLAMSQQLIDSRTSSPRGAHCYGPFFLEYALLAEYNLLQRQRLPGVYVVPAASTPLEWFGVLFIRQGYYQEGVFRFTVKIPQQFPDGDCPRVILDSPVFHPLVHPESGELDVRRGFQKWKRNSHHLWHVLLYLRKAFYKIDTAQPVNPEAAVMYEKARDMFTLRVTECVKRSREHLLTPPASDDPHSIVFSQFRPEVHGPVRQAMLNPKREEQPSGPGSAGYSWVQPGSLEIFSKPDSL